MQQSQRNWSNKIQGLAGVWTLILIPCTVCFSLLLLVSCSHGSVLSQKTPPDKPDPDTPIVTQQGSFDIGNGVNLQPSYYNNGEINFGWTVMKTKEKIKTVRIEIEPGFTTQARKWITQAASEGYTVIATYHKSGILGSDDPMEVAQAATWWKENYPSFLASLPDNKKGTKDTGRLIINIINEWGSHKITPALFAQTYNEAIGVIRSFYQGFIIIDIPGWCQETYTAYLACKESTPKIEDPAVVLSTHIYPGVFNEGRVHIFQASDLEDLKNTGHPCMVGEFGDGQGESDWSCCVSYATGLGWPVLAWCWNGDGNDLNMVSPSWKDNPNAQNLLTITYFDKVYKML